MTRRLLDRFVGAGGKPLRDVSTLNVLTDRERDILEARRLRDEPATLEELSQKYGASRERVRQIEVRAFEKIQRSIRGAAIEERLTRLATLRISRAIRRASCATCATA